MAGGKRRHQSRGDHCRENPTGGIFATTTFKVTLSLEEAALTCRFIRSDAQGNLFLDAEGTQDPRGI